MKTLKIILLIMGLAYVLIGGGVTLAFLGTGMPFYSAIAPMIFIVLGIGFLVGVWMIDKKKRDAIKNGIRYAAKIHSYVEDGSILVNGKHPYNVRAHYWDENGIEREAILKTSFSYGEGTFPIGMTIDIFEHEGYYGYDEHSVRSEVLPREDELMDNRPIDPNAVHTTAALCPNCGASFEAALHYVNRCPYCDSYLNI